MTLLTVVLFIPSKIDNDKRTAPLRNSSLNCRFSHLTAYLISPLQCLIGFSSLAGPKPNLHPSPPNLLFLQDSPLFVANIKNLRVIFDSFLSLTLIKSISKLLTFPSKYIQNSILSSLHHYDAG